MKTRSSTTKIFIRKFIPITHSIIYHYQKAKKSFFGSQKSLRVQMLLRVLIDGVFLLFRFHSDRVLLRLFRDRALLRVLRDRFFLRVFTNRFFSWVISALFPACHYFFIKKCYQFFLLKSDVLFCIKFSKRS